MLLAIQKIPARSLARCTRRVFAQHRFPPNPLSIFRGLLSMCLRRLDYRWFLFLRFCRVLPSIVISLRLAKKRKEKNHPRYSSITARGTFLTGRRNDGNPTRFCGAERCRHRVPTFSTVSENLQARREFSKIIIEEDFCLGAVFVQLSFSQYQI